VIVTSISGLVRTKVGPARDRERDPDANPDRDGDPDPTRNLNPTPTVAAPPAATVTVQAPSGGVAVWFAQCRCLIARLVLNHRLARPGQPKAGHRPSWASAARSELLAALTAGTITMTEVLARADDVAWYLGQAHLRR
jgi:hypothetical protein